MQNKVASGLDCRVHVAGLRPPWRADRACGHLAPSTCSSSGFGDRGDVGAASMQSVPHTGLLPRSDGTHSVLYWAPLSRLS